MKRMIFFTAISFLTILTACNTGSSVTKATGVKYEVVLVMDDADYNSSVGKSIMEELTAPIPYLTQAESSMKVQYVRSDLFGGMFKYVRNILIVNINNKQYTKVSLIPSNDEWARGQAILYLNAPEAGMIEDFLAANPRAIVDYFSKAESARWAVDLKNSHSALVTEKVKEKFGFTIYAQSDIKKWKEDDNCLWFSNDAVIGRSDLLIYSFPYRDKNTFTLEYLVAKRDSITKMMIPGSFEGSYMSTEKRVVDYSATTLNGKYCGVLRGWWRMEGGDIMGGPFVSYARVDEENQRVIVTEGFVYEPDSDRKKGFYMRQLEAALQSTRFPYEENVQTVTVEKTAEE